MVGPLDSKGGYGHRGARARILALVHLQNRLCAMSYSSDHETSHLRSYALKGGAQSPGSRIALLLCLRPAPLPDSAFERSRRKPTTDSPLLDRKSTRLNSSHANISYAVFCLKKKNIP